MINNIKEYLLKNEADFSEFSHEPVGNPLEYSKLIGTRLEQQAKALLLRCKSRGNKYFIVVTCPANKKVDFKILKQKINNVKSVRVAEEKDLLELTDCSPGTLPPLGKIWNLQLYMDKDLLNESKVYFNAGSLDHSLVMAPESIYQLEDAILF